MFPKRASEGVAAHMHDDMKACNNMQWSHFPNAIAIQPRRYLHLILFATTHQPLPNNHSSPSSLSPSSLPSFSFSSSFPFPSPSLPNFPFNLLGTFALTPACLFFHIPPYRYPSLPAARSPSMTPPLTRFQQEPGQTKCQAPGLRGGGAGWSLLEFEEGMVIDSSIWQRTRTSRGLWQRVQGLR